MLQNSSSVTAESPFPPARCWEIMENVEQGQPKINKREENEAALLGRVWQQWSLILAACIEMCVG